MPSEMAGQTSPMPRYRPDLNDHPVKAAGEGWLVNADQLKVVQFKPDTPTAHAEWVILRTFHWQPPDYPIPQTRRRMLRHNAIEAWGTMLKMGWDAVHHQCVSHPPASRSRMNNILFVITFLSIANHAISIPLVPAPCASYARSFHSVVDQLKRFNGMALTYPGLEAERNRLRFYQQIKKRLAPLISCLADHKSDILEYYQEVNDMTETQIETFPSN